MTITITTNNKKLRLVTILVIISVIVLHGFLLMLKMPIFPTKKIQKLIEIEIVTNKEPSEKKVKKSKIQAKTQPKITNTPKAKLPINSVKTVQKKLTVENPEAIVKKHTIKQEIIKKETVKTQAINKKVLKKQTINKQTINKPIQTKTTAKIQNKISKNTKPSANNKQQNKPQAKITESIKQKNSGDFAKQTIIENSTLSKEISIKEDKDTKKVNNTTQINDINENKQNSHSQNITNKTYNFSNAEIQWKKQPILTLSSKITDKIRKKGTYTVTVKAKVNKSGSIINLQKIKSCGNGRIDKQAIKSAKQAKFIPFKRNGVAVRGNVIFSLIYHL